MSTSIDDLSSRIASLIDSDVSSTHLADYSYLGLGTVVQQDSPQADLRYTLISLTGSDDPDTGDIYSGLDRFGRIVDLRWRKTSNNSDLSRVQYGYDPSSNRTWRENPTATANSAEYDWKYSYDGLQRLKAGQRGTLNGTQTGLTSQVFSQCWSLDETGNWSGFKQSDDGTTWSLEQTRSANPVNELTALDATVGEQWANPQYDPNGNMTRIPRPGLNRPSWANLTTAQWASLTVDDWARMEVAPTYKATFDAWNRLVSLADGGDSGLIQQNQYYGRGFRVATKSYTDGTLSETRHAYFTDQWQIVEERLGTSPDSADPERQFVWGVRYIDDLILRDRDIGGGMTSERLYALQDANWNVTAVSNTSGAVTERYEYDPYGNLTVLSGAFVPRATSVYDWETTYCGYRWDQSTGLFTVRHRVYHPRLGTWVTRDPIEYKGGMNLYAYISSRPIISSDPMGLDPGAGLSLAWETTRHIDDDRVQLLKDTKCKDPACKKELQELFDIIDKAEKATPKDDGAGPCGTLVNELLLNREIRKNTASAKDTPEIKGKIWKCITIQRKYFHIVPRIYAADYHQMLEVKYTCCNKTEVIHIDAGTHLGGDGTGNIGGDDNLYRNKLPGSLIPTNGGVGDLFPTKEEYDSLCKKKGVSTDPYKYIRLYE